MSIEITLYPRNASREELIGMLDELGYSATDHLWAPQNVEQIDQFDRLSSKFKVDDIGSQSHKGEQTVELLTIGPSEPTTITNDSQ